MRSRAGLKVTPKGGEVETSSDVVTKKSRFSEIIKTKCLRSLFRHSPPLGFTLRIPSLPPSMRSADFLAVCLREYVREMSLR